MLNGMINVGTVDCQKHHSFCQGEGVRAYPEIRLYSHSAARSDQYQYVPMFSSYDWALCVLWFALRC